MNRRKHGYKFTKPLAMQECDRALHSIQVKKPTKVIVTVESAFAEFADQVNYRNGLYSASKHRHGSGVIREGMGGCIKRL